MRELLDGPDAGSTDKIRGTTPRVLVVTNDFPPKVGGVQQYVWNLVRNLPPDSVSVLAPNFPGWREHDASQPFSVIRWPAGFMWPTDDLRRRVHSLIRRQRPDVVLFGHGLPLASLGPGIARRGVPYVVFTHGIELWMSRLPGVRRALAAAVSLARDVTAVSEYTARAISSVIPPGVRLSVLHPGVDEQRFSPTVDGSQVRSRHGLDDRQVVLCVSRLIPRKGQDILIRSMPLVRHLAADATLLLVGTGPYRRHLEAEAATVGADSVVFAGGVADEELPAYYAACDLFAMPCRSRLGGLEVEGFGIVFLEAAASGKAAVAGTSGGAQEAVADNLTGILVEPREAKAVGLATARLLVHPDLAARFGAAGRARVEEAFTWKAQADKLMQILLRAVS